MSGLLCLACHTERMLLHVVVLASVHVLDRVCSMRRAQRRGLCASVTTKCSAGCGSLCLQRQLCQPLVIKGAKLLSVLARCLCVHAGTVARHA